MSVTQTDTVTLLANGRSYSGWFGIRFNRGLDRMCGDGDIPVTERWAGTTTPWQLPTWTPVVLMDGSDRIATGYIDGYEPSGDARSHNVTIRIRSKTEDLVDCALDIPSGQFQGYTLGAIANAMCQPFGIGVVLQTDASMVVQDATIQRAETVYEFLERLARMSAVLLTDDAMGNLVLTRTGSTEASGALTYGENIETYRGRLNVAKRFSHYIVKGQRGLGATGSVQTSQQAVAIDPGVPRYRPHVSIAESQLSAEGMQQRANWEMRYAFGRATLADIEVTGWRQPDGSLWVVNKMVSVDCTPLQINADMLIAGVSYRYDPSRGKTCLLTVGPPEGFTPDPGEVRLRKHRGRKGHSGVWELNGIGSANQ